MFTLQFLPRKETIDIRRDKILELVQRHRLDQNSPEAISKYSSIINKIDYTIE